MKRTAIIILLLAAATTIWTWWPKQEQQVTGTATNENLLLTSTGKEVAPELVASLRVATWNNGDNQVKVFEVAKKGGEWVIPSHFDYPADGGDRVGSTAGTVLNVPRGPFVTLDPAQHAALGVVDPMKEGSADSEGRGKKVTLKDEGGTILVDLIIGKKVENADAYYVRNANSDDVYQAKVSPDIRTAFRDWVKTDLMEIEKDSIYSVVVLDQSVDETYGVIRERSTTSLIRDPFDGTWVSDQIPKGKIMNTSTVQALEGEITNLLLVGVRPYSNMWLQARGFYVTGSGSLVGNEGSVQINTKEGIIYHLFFGEIALGDEDDVSPEAASSQQAVGADETHNRYMAVFVQYVPDYDEGLDAINNEPESKSAADSKDETAGEGSAAAPEKTKEQRKAERMQEGQMKADKAMKRFNQFFYVISDASFKKLRPSATDLYSNPKTAEED